MEGAKLGLAVIFAIIGVVIGITAMTNQAPTVATATATSCDGVNCSTALENAGITSNTLAGTVYSFTNVFWALGVLGLAVLAVYAGGKKAGAF